MKKLYIILAFVLSLGSITKLAAQGKKVWASGQARSVLQNNTLELDGDTVTPKKLNSGHALVDLAINAKPNDETFLHGMVRIRNDFGGFWGSGVSFDIRQLYVKGLIKQSIRYQIGDINYRLSPYTFYNHNEELSSHQSAGLDILRQLLHYDLFYTEDHTWRQQGAAVDFALEFEKFVDELEVNLFTSRNRASDFQQLSDRIFFGGNAQLKQSKNLVLGVNYIDLMDISGTSNSNTEFHNPVISGTTLLKIEKDDWAYQFQSESGISEMYEINASNNKLRDYFCDLALEAYSKNHNMKAKLSYINVGPQFRSVGAQTKRVNFQAINSLIGRYGNSQTERSINQLDLAQDASIYNFNFNQNLAAFSPIYDNATPYGTATPNRQGAGFQLSRESKDELYTFKANVQSLSEIVGQGGDDLRTFQIANAEALLNIDKLIPKYKNALSLSLGYDHINTNRETSFSEANIDLKTTVIDVGLKIGISKEFEGIFNIRQISSSGNELLAVRNSNTEVSDFQKFETDLNENLILFGLRYYFSEVNTLNMMWQKLSWDDTKNNSPEYGMNQFVIVYNLKF